MRCVDSTRTSRTVTLRPHDKRHTVNGRLCADHTPRQPVRQQHCLTRISHPIHPDAQVLRNAVANVQLSEALRRTCLPVAHGPTVPVQQSMTDIPHHRPSSPNLSQLAVLSRLKVHYRIVSNVYTHSTCYLVVFTACVMRLWTASIAKATPRRRTSFNQS